MFHVLGNVLRLLFTIAGAPFYLFTPRVVVSAVDNYLQSSWLLEYAMTPDAVLSDARGGGKGEYDVTGFQPSWVLEVKIQNGALHNVRQIPFSEKDLEAGYTALSYPMRSAAVLATEAGFVPGPAPQGREYTLADRRTISGFFLQLYCSAARREGNPDRTEYIWLDEFCLSDNNDQDDEAIATQRSTELGRLADIFRGAIQVAVFCDEENCDHTGLSCIWGQRLFTIPEILHAKTVLRLTRWRQGKSLTAQISRKAGSEFREAMQTNAARGNKWHL
jgi:hypothetical protein